MSNVLKDYPMDDFQVPEGVTFVGIDPKTGRLSSGPRSTKEVFIQGTEPGARGSELTPRTPESGKPLEKQVIKIDETDDETLREER
jgi:membrane carboxypeptidase/penicillin-binding protein